VEDGGMRTKLCLESLKETRHLVNGGVLESAMLKLMLEEIGGRVRSGLFWFKIKNTVMNVKVT
jgi:hypothetical protein